MVWSQLTLQLRNCRLLYMGHIQSPSIYGPYTEDDFIILSVWVDLIFDFGINASSYSIVEAFLATNAAAIVSDVKDAFNCSTSAFTLALSAAVGN